MSSLSDTIRQQDQRTREIVKEELQNWGVLRPK